MNSRIRGLIRESGVSPANLVWPAFIQEGKNLRSPIESMPGISRLSIDQLLADCEKAFNMGVPAVALFPALEESLKNSDGKESLNPGGLLQRAVRKLKKTIPDMLVITDVALDPYSSDGHDGLVNGGIILNDETLPLLAAMAVAQAEAAREEELSAKAALEVASSWAPAALALASAVVRSALGLLPVAP